MPDEHGTPSEGQTQDEQTTAEESPRGPSDGAAGASSEAPSGGATSDWPELDAYREQLRAEHAAWTERLRAVQTQLAAVSPILAGIAAQYAALGIEEDIHRLCEEVLGGAGMVQRVRFDFDLERYVTLAWPAPADPRPELAAAHSEGEYRVDVWFGIDPDGRGRVRVEGAKRLEAPLPTSRERLRRVLLGAIQAPRYVSPTAAEAAAAGAPQPEAEQPAAAAEETPVESATPRPGDTEAQPPAEEQVIPLGPADEHPGAGG